MRTWPSPSGFRLTAWAAPTTPSALIPASAAYSDFFLNISILAITPLSCRLTRSIFEPTTHESYYTFNPATNSPASRRALLWAFCNARLTSHIPGPPLRDDPLLEQRRDNPLGLSIVVGQVDTHRTYVRFARHRIDLRSTIHAYLVLALVD